MENIEGETIENVNWTGLPDEILINIFDYLSAGDLQQVRLTCQTWNGLTYWPKLLKKFKLLINHRHLDSIYEHLSKDKNLVKRLPYEAVELQGVEVSEKIFVVLNALGQYVRQLSLRNSPIFGMIKECLPKLEELKMREFENIEKDELRLLNLNEFPNFKALNINDSSLPKFVTSHFLKSLLKNPFIKMEKLCVVIRKETVHENLVLEALKRYTNSLKHLSMHLQVSVMKSFLQKMEDDVFPYLTNLEYIVFIDFNSRNFIANVMERIPQEAPLRSCVLISLMALDNALLQLILSKWSETLEHINVHYSDYITFEAFQSVRLKSLKLSCNSVLDGNDLVECLTPGTLEVLILSSNNSGVVKFFPEPAAPRENRKVNIENSSVQHIFQTQRRLRRLAINQTDSLSDETLIGSDNCSASIRDLTGLQVLSLEGGENVTDRSLMEALKFKELRVLQLSQLDNITSVGIKELVKNCPALEHVYIICCDKIDDDAILYVLRDTKRLRLLGISSCPLLTIKILDYVAEYGKNLNKFHICGAEIRNDEMFQNKLQTVLADLKITPLS